MSLNPVVSLLGRRLRLAVIGGGPGSFIGGTRRLAAALDALGIRLVDHLVLAGDAMVSFRARGLL